jgi:protein TonB
MRVTSLILICVCTVSGVQAQSKKVINQQLLAELAAVQKTADSIESVHGKKQGEINNLKISLIAAKRKFDQLKNEETVLRQRIDSKQSTLKDLGFDGYSIVSYAEVKSLVSPALNKDYSVEPVWYSKKIILLRNPYVRDLTEMKVKAQNEALKLEIDSFKQVNNKNKTLLAEEQQIADSCLETINELNVLNDKYTILNKILSDKHTLLKNKYDDLIEKKQAEDRLKREKEVLAASKTKKPKTIPLVPPVINDSEILEKQIREEINREGDFSGDYFDAAPPMPEPPPPSSEPVIYDVVEEPAEFPGGVQAMKDYLAANLKIPTVAEELGINGKVYLRFVVSETGSISNVSVKKGITDCPECDMEAVRVVKKMPKWEPAKNDGKVVNCWFTLPVAFKTE